jgi:hypothetical protein
MYRFLFCAILAILSVGQAFPQKVLDYRGTFLFPEGQDSVMLNKEIFTYTPEGWLSSKAVYYYDKQLDQWLGNSYPVEECIVCPGKHEFGYNIKGQKIRTTSFSWAGTTKGWVKSLETLLEYDLNGLVASTRSGRFDASGDFTYDLGVEMNYDESGNMSERLYYRWNTSNQDWVPLSRESWQFEVTGPDTLIQLTRRTWSTSANDWGPPSFQRTEKDYDDSGKLIKTDWLVPYGSSWRVYDREERTYNEDGRLKQVLLKKLYGTTWSEELRTTFTYDDSGRRVYEERQGRMEKTIGLRQQLKLGRYFDEDGDVWQEVWYYWDAETKRYRFGNKDYYFYRSLTGTNPLPSSPVISVYPNPTSGLIRITGMDNPLTVSLYTLQGHLLKTFPRVTESIDLSGFPAGMYLLDLVAEDRSSTKMRIVLFRES